MAFVKNEIKEKIINTIIRIKILIQLTSLIAFIQFIKISI